MIGAALALEALPWGAVLNFAVAPESGGGVDRQTFSYFSLMPVGYANVGPFFAAVTTVLLAVLVLISCFGEKRGKLCGSIYGISAVAAVFSLGPLIFGVDYYSLTGLFITLLLVSSAVVGFIRSREYE